MFTIIIKIRYRKRRTGRGLIAADDNPLGAVCIDIHIAAMIVVVFLLFGQREIVRQPFYADLRKV